MFQLLTAPQAQPAQAHRYIVELASTELELDASGNPVPVDYQRIDVVVSEPSSDAIATLLQAAGYLDGWGIVSCWRPADCDCF